MSLISNELREQIEKDISIDRFKLIEESARTPILLSRYTLFCMEQKQKLEEKKMNYYRLYKFKRLYYLGQAEDAVYKTQPLDKKVLRQDVEFWLNADTELLKAKDDISRYTLHVEFLEKIVKEIERRTFTIKNMQEMIKFESGC